MGWACVVLGAGDEARPRAFLEFGEHPVGQSLKRPANAVLTGKRQCQPGGKQGAENQRGGHGEEISMGEGGIKGRHQKRAAESGSAVT